MVNQLVKLGEEFTQKWTFRQDEISRDVTLVIGLWDSQNESSYDSGNDSLPDTMDISDFDSEPSDGNYARQNLNMDSTDVSVLASGGNWVSELANHDFDVRNTTGFADHYFVAATFQAEETGDSSQNLHLLYVGQLDERKDLSANDQITNESAGLALN